MIKSTHFSRLEGPEGMVSVNVLDLRECQLG